ncbi:hypothetical protein COCON_G00156500 [Conger conger]|uniref:Uncharacterized protein n=1 Tax=Conger conger TaxID=82655 RepID=A0A9Q1D9A8_CONCO|nr:hypothetical protein COCON_G00156500 [Conger conger]
MSKKQTSLDSFFAKGKRPNEETEEEPTTTKKKKAAFNRQYQESYLKYGFIATGDSHGEAGFSAVTATKTKLRSRLDIKNTLRVSLSPITPRWDLLVAKKQAQGSH